MDIHFYKTGYHNQVGAVDRTKRVRKPNKDEAEENNKKFADQLQLLAREEDEEKQGHGNRQSEEEIHSENERKKHPDTNQASPESKGVGVNIDITI